MVESDRLNPPAVNVQMCEAKTFALSLNTDHLKCILKSDIK